jgi:hypothetical protein
MSPRELVNHIRSGAGGKSSSSTGLAPASASRADTCAGSMIEALVDPIQPQRMQLCSHTQMKPTFHRIGTDYSIFYTISHTLFFRSFFAVFDPFGVFDVVLGVFAALGASGSSCLFEDFGVVEDFKVVRVVGVFEAFGAVGALVLLDAFLLLFLDTFGLLFLDTFGALGLGGSADCWSGSLVAFSFIERWLLFMVRSILREGHPEEGIFA